MTTIAPVKARAIIERAQDPVWFCRHVLGHDSWALPQQIMRAVNAPRSRTAVKSCHSSGKTFTAAEMVLWWVFVKRGIAITTAPTWNQVEKLLWREIHIAHAGARFPLGGELIQTELKVGPNTFAIGLSTNEGVRFQGWHTSPGHPMLIILDEGPGVAPDIYEAIEGIRAGGDVRVLVLGNPVVASGPFYDAFATHRASWTTFTIDALATPNFTDDLSRPMTLDELRALTADELQWAPRPYLTRRSWVREKLDEWGEQSPLWASRVRGDFPKQSEDALISLAWLERASVPVDPVLAVLDPVVAGLDVAGPGEDETVLTIRTAGRPSYILSMQAWAHADPRGAVVAALAPYRGRLDTVNVDSIGVGYHFARHLEDQGFPVTDVNVGERPTRNAQDKFANLKAELYWNLRQALEAGDVVGLTDDRAVGQCASIRYRQDRRGHIAIERKDAARKRGVKSPDRAESLMLAYATGGDDAGEVTMSNYMGRLYR